MDMTEKHYRVLITEEISSLPESDPHISYDYQPDLWRDLEQLRQVIEDVEGLIVRNQTIVDQDLIASARSLKVIGRLGAGLDNIELQAALAADIQVVYAPRACSVSVAEYCLACILNILRNLPQAMQATSSGEWIRAELTGRELAGALVGLIGYGRIAKALAERLQLLGGQVIVNTRSPEKVPPDLTTVSFTELLERSDIISLHVPGGWETHHLMGSQQFKRMKPSSWLINTARGSVVDEEALYQALLSGEIAGAVSDVREQEPPPAGRLEKLPNFYPTPHIAAFTSGAQSRVNQAVFADVAAVLKGFTPEGVLKRGH